MDAPPPLPRQRPSVVAASKESFGVQAAKFSLYAPLMVLVVGFVSNISQRNGQAVALTLFGLNMLIIVVGLALGLLALAMIPKFGKQGILIRALLGTAINLTLLVLTLVVVLPLFTHASVRRQLVGHWKARTVTDPSIGTMDIALNEDGTFTFNSVPRKGAGVKSTGQWVFLRDQAVGVSIETANGVTAPKPINIGLGKVQSIDTQQMTLSTDKGPETYDRVP